MRKKHNVINTCNLLFMRNLIFIAIGNAVIFFTSARSSTVPVIFTIISKRDCKSYSLRDRTFSVNAKQRISDNATINGLLVPVSDLINRKEANIQDTF